MSRCPSTPPWPPGGRQTERDSFVNDDHAPFNRVWNWFCCLAFWSNYSKLAKFTHLHDLWVLCSSIYVASKQSINFNGKLVMTSLFGHNKISPSCTLDGTPPRGKTSLKQSVIWNKTCSRLMSTPRPHYYKRSLTTGLLPPFICTTGKGEKKHGHWALPEEAARWTSRIRRGKWQENWGMCPPGVYRQPWKGVPSSYHHIMIRWERPHCLIIGVSAQFSYSFIISYLGPSKLLEGRGAISSRYGPSTRHGTLLGM